MEYFLNCGLTPPRAQSKEGLCTLRHSVYNIDLIQTTLEQVGIPPKPNLLKKKMANYAKECVHWFLSLSLAHGHQLHFRDLEFPNCFHLEANFVTSIIQVGSIP